MTPRPYPSLITLFPWGNVFRVSHDTLQKEVLANKPICKLGTVWFQHWLFPSSLLPDLTCVLMSNSWGPTETIAPLRLACEAMSRRWKFWGEIQWQGEGERKGEERADAFTRQQPSTGQPEMLTGCGRAFYGNSNGTFQQVGWMVKKAQAVDEAGPGYVLSLRRMVTQTKYWTLRRFSFLIFKMEIMFISQNTHEDQNNFVNVTMQALAADSRHVASSHFPLREAVWYGERLEWKGKGLNSDHGIHHESPWTSSGGRSSVLLSDRTWLT